MNKWLVKNRLYFIGALTGCIAGYLYWKFIGCVNGTCLITSNPVRSAVYFAIMGALLFGIFKKENKSTGSQDQQ
jgi:hypothetical protein